MAVKIPPWDPGGLILLPERDPLTPTEKAANAYAASLVSTYQSLWGVEPPSGYIERAITGHMNVFEFEAHERAKPAFRSSPRYREEMVYLAQTLAARFGFVR